MANIDSVQEALTALKRTFDTKQRQKKISASVTFEARRLAIPGEQNHYLLVCVNLRGKPIYVRDRGGKNILAEECRPTITGSTSLPLRVYRTSR